MHSFLWSNLSLWMIHRWYMMCHSIQKHRDLTNKWTPHLSRKKKREREGKKHDYKTSCWCLSMNLMLRNVCQFILYNIMFRLTSTNTLNISVHKCKSSEAYTDQMIAVWERRRERLKLLIKKAPLPRFMTIQQRWSIKNIKQYLCSLYNIELSPPDSVAQKAHESDLNDCDLDFFLWWRW